ncbi:hypothetical protein ACS0TY_024167 [Phlomoides rotata]
MPATLSSSSGFIVHLHYSLLFLSVFDEKPVSITHPISVFRLKNSIFFQIFVFSCCKTLDQSLFGFFYSSIQALNEALTIDVQRLKLATAKLNGDKFQQLLINLQMFHSHANNSTSSR